MEQEQAFLQAILEQPRDAALRLIFADWLEEHDDPRGELLRLTHLLTQETDQANRHALESRQRSLLAAVVQPVGPFCTNELGMEFAWVPPGVFLMGSPATEAWRSNDEIHHRVRLTRGLWLGVHSVTGAQWQSVMGSALGHGKGGDLPVDQVSWEALVQFCAALGKRDGRSYREPTEAEWEYACRAGTTTPFHFGSALNGEEANCDGNYPHGISAKGPYLGRTTPVGSYRPNAFGLFDMHGNVWEWCQDHYDMTTLLVDGIEDPVNIDPRFVDRRVVRGGSWFNSASTCRSAMRHWIGRGSSVSRVGSRVCFRAEGEST
jgi:uncharacterized protein (TIGR02996 family)